jgi:hypothetical protein
MGLFSNFQFPIDGILIDVREICYAKLGGPQRAIAANENQVFTGNVGAGRWFSEQQR